MDKPKVIAYTEYINNYLRAGWKLLQSTPVRIIQDPANPSRIYQELKRGTHE